MVQFFACSIDKVVVGCERHQNLCFMDSERRSVYRRFPALSDVSGNSRRILCLPNRTWYPFFDSLALSSLGKDQTLVANSFSYFFQDPFCVVFLKMKKWINKSSIRECLVIMIYTNPQVMGFLPFSEFCILHFPKLQIVRDGWMHEQTDEQMKKAKSNKVNFLL